MPFEARFGDALTTLKDKVFDALVFATPNKAIDLESWLKVSCAHLQSKRSGLAHWWVWGERVRARGVRQVSQCVALSVM